MQILLRSLCFLAAVSVVFFLLHNLRQRDKEPVIPVAEAALQGESDPAEQGTVISPESQDQGQATPVPVLTQEAAVPETPTPTPAEGVSDAVQDGAEDTSTLQTIELAAQRQQLSDLTIEELAAYLRERQVPEDLVSFMEGYPESREFVTDYLFRPKQPRSMDISGEVTKGTIPHFLQWDERWGYEFYDDSYMAVAGCGPTALSEVYSGLTGKTDMNPYEMAQWAADMGYHVRGEGTSWDMMLGGAWQLGLNAWDVGADEESILDELRSGHPIICAVSPGDFTYFGHFIVLADADDEGNISIRDSNSLIRTQRTWTADELLWQIAGLWAYSYDG